jgi:60 kDa SS-A/Ro ribonucleoprotein
MTKSLVTHLLENSTVPQSEGLAGQVENSAGGYSYPVDSWTRLTRFLILGTEGGTYYASERKQTREETKSVTDCIALDAQRTVDLIVDVSTKGRAPKNDPAVLALAICAASDNPAARKLAYEAIPKVCRIGTHLFQFVTAVNELRGWSRGLRTAVGNWYTHRDDKSLAMQLIKYQQRDGMSHRDVLRLAHPTAQTDGQAKLFTYVVKGIDEVAARNNGNVPQILNVLRDLHADPNVNTAIKAIKEFDLPRECLPTSVLDQPAVWDALLPTMPMTAMLRNLATMTRVGLLTPMAPQTQIVLEKLKNLDALKRARVHPIHVLTAQLAYASGRGLRNTDKTWNAVPVIVSALEDAFYAAFGTLTPTNKRFYLGLDVSGSMDGGMIAGIPGFTPRIAAAAMAMVTVRTENQYECAAFTSAGTSYYGSSNRYSGLYHRGGIELFGIKRTDTLQGVMHKMSRMPFGGTDCSLPMLDAAARKIPADMFIVYTDNETWAGNMHPSEALRRYRAEMQIPAKLVVVGMTANEFSIADPRDGGMMDVVGFDTATPSLIADFATQ